MCISKVLMHTAKRHALGQGKPALELQARIELAASQETFAKMGFVEFKRTEHKGFDQPTSIPFRKKLT